MVRFQAKIGPSGRAEFEVKDEFITFKIPYISKFCAITSVISLSFERNGGLKATISAPFVVKCPSWKTWTWPPHPFETSDAHEYVSANQQYGTFYLCFIFLEHLRTFFNLNSVGPLVNRASVDNKKGR